MNISRTAFVILFLVFAFAFIFGTTLILEQPPEALLGTDTEGSSDARPSVLGRSLPEALSAPETGVAWKKTVATVLSPIKLVLIGPLLPVLHILHNDPDTPPPFFLALFAGYWSLLAVVLHHFLRAGRRRAA